MMRKVSAPKIIFWALAVLFFVFIVRLIWLSSSSGGSPTPNVEIDELEYGFPVPSPFEPPLFDRSYYDQFQDCVKC